MTPAQRDMLHSLGYLYLLHGQKRRALILLLMAARGAPGDLGLLQTLAFALICCGDASRALEIIDNLDTGPSAPPHVRLLRSRALLQLGRVADARQCFQEFVAARPVAPSAA